VKSVQTTATFFAGRTGLSQNAHSNLNDLRAISNAIVPSANWDTFVVLTSNSFAVPH
jgi:hypothetical protein